MKKVGIMTWFSYNNYGTVLQAYATSKFIEKLGYEPQIINYIPKVRKTNIFDIKGAQIVKKIYEIKNKKKYTKILQEINQKSEEFKSNNLKLTTPCETEIELTEISQDKLAIICGSDQIWSPLSFDKHYYLDFVDQSKKIAYAPSFGVSTIPYNLKEKTEELLKDFKYLSARELKGQEIIKELSEKKATLVVDPTLLLTEKDWVKKLNLNKNEEKYIVCYFLGYQKEYYSTAKKIAKELNYKIIIIPGNTHYLDKNKYKDLNICSPQKFVELIMNAKFVITDSYHGMLFSINFNKDFLIFKRFKDKKKSSQNSRIYTILKEYNLSDRMYHKNMSIQKIISSKINYENVNKILDAKRRKSIEYLKSSIKEIEQVTEKAVEKNSEKITNMCTGCGMCQSVCPKNCILISQNDNGFYSYKIDKSKCINCGLCRKVCAQCVSNRNKIKSQKIYSVFSKKKDIIESSSSGGIAYHLAEYAINEEMKVIGCTYDITKNIAKHIVISKKEDIKKLSGSKYIQSYTVDAFKEIKKMKSGLIIGTPCQIASINNYLTNVKKRENFILVDLICHGVPTYNLWKNIIQKYNNINSIKFRDKKYNSKKVLTINNFKVKDNMYYDFFNSSLIFNECCYDCNYRETSCADIRIGDYWGPKSKTNKDGISMVISNTAKGEKIINQLRNNNDLYIQDESIDDYFKYQQTKNIPLPLNYYEIMTVLKKSNINLKKINSKYTKKINLDITIRKKLYPIYKRIIKHEK